MANPTTPNIGLNKVDRTSPTTTYFNLETNLDDNWDKIDLLVPFKSTADITYYVSPAGSDSNNGTSAATPFKTIGKAVSMIPQVCNHIYTIQVAAGTYSEDVTMKGIVGSGSIAFNGDYLNRSNYNVSSFWIQNVVPIVSIVGFNLTSTSKSGVYVARSTHVIVNQCSCTTVSATSAGIGFDGSSGRVTNNIISNRTVAISAGYTANIIAAGNIGTGNSVSLQANDGSKLAYNGSIPGATTAFNPASGSIVYSQVPQATSGSITYYVSTTGNDSNDGLTSGTPLRNIQTAINRIPQIVNHDVVIYLAQGTYSEDLQINGFKGLGSIGLIGGADSTAAVNYKINSATVRYCDRVTFLGIEAVTAAGAGFLAVRCMDVNVRGCRVTTTSASIAAITSDNTRMYVYVSLLSNRVYGIEALNMSTVMSDNNSGTGNTTGLYASKASTIGKYGTQPAGTTAEGTFGGGAIR